MKHYFDYHHIKFSLKNLLLVIGLILPLHSPAATVSLATAPLANATTTTVRPNLMFILDTSGSMDFDYTPDWADDNLCMPTSGNTNPGSNYNSACRNAPPFYSGDYNSQYYNPAIYYKPPVNADGNSRASQTTWTSVKNDAYDADTNKNNGSTNLLTSIPDIEWCTDDLSAWFYDNGWKQIYTDCLTNDNYLLPGVVLGKTYKNAQTRYASGSVTVATGSPDSPTTATRTLGPYYYSITPGEYCDSSNLTNCQFTQTAIFSYPAKVRWCKSTTGPTRTASQNASDEIPAPGSCQALRTGSFTAARYPTRFSRPAAPAIAAMPAVPASAAFKISVSGCSSTKKVGIQSVTVGGVGDILTSATDTERYADDLVSELEDNIGKFGYTAKDNGSGKITISAPLSAGDITAPIGLSRTAGSHSSCKYSLSPSTPTFGGYQAAIPAQAAVLAGYSGAFIRTDIIPSITSYPKATSRKDCAGSTCTYNEEMTNFANWWTYYHTRMQGMKTAASHAFKPISSDYRVGFININGTQHLRINNFEAGAGNQKETWYSRLFSSNASGGTPLREALARVGRIFAGKISSSDPVQFSCQQNFALLTTDGYWNGAGGVEINGSSSIGNFDGGDTDRPMYEGSTASSNSLSDVAKYYYDTDLRTSTLGNCTGTSSTDFPSGTNVCANNVFVSGDDNNIKQHMTTMTLGLGVDGTLVYTSDYKTAATGDFADIKNGTKNWSVPASDTERAVDDLWHAAVNGQGTYFSAKNPDQLSTGLNAALAAITSKVGAGAAAATSTLAPINGDNFAYVASYTTVKWTGNLEARAIDINTGDTSLDASWCVEDVVAASCTAPSSIVAETSGGSTRYNCVTPSSTAATCIEPGVLDGTNCKIEVPTACTGTMASKVGGATDARKILMKSGTSLVDFTYTNLAATSQSTNFDSTFLSANLDQWSSLTASQQSIAGGDNLVNFLRGQNGYEDRTSNIEANRLYRYREAVFGDAIESTPAYIAKPTFSYTDLGYSDFKTAQVGRSGTVYIGANDGMLHAFNGNNGVERWAYVPSMVIPNMWALADKNYATKHTYSVNGDPNIYDICINSCDNAAAAVWRTILVAGLNGGGRGYYALDITDPATPSLLWEFNTSNDNDLGYTFGNPVVTKLTDGTWVVLFTSGYNNTTGSNPGKGFLYVVNALTGIKISKFPTGVGSATTPSGLSKIISYIDDAEKNNTATYTYGGDLLGNVWRFDINAAAATGTNPMLFATLKDSSGTSQPITTRPELASVGGKRILFVGTGKYLEKSDLTDTQQQTLYAIKDDNAVATLVNPRTSLIAQTMTADDDTSDRIGSDNPVDLTTGRGWYVDFPDSGERQNVASTLVQGTLQVPTTVPSNTVCSPGGYGWLNYFDYKTGGVIGESNTVSKRTNAPIVGINVYYINGSPVISVVTADRPTPTRIETEFKNLLGGFQNKRVIWRELIQ